VNPAEQALAMLDATANDLEQARSLARQNALNYYMDDAAYQFWRRVLLNLVPVVNAADWN
jgi:hypothetical protein